MSGRGLPGGGLVRQSDSPSLVQLPLYYFCCLATAYIDLAGVMFPNAVPKKALASLRKSLNRR